MIAIIVGLIVRLLCIRQIGSTYWSIRPQEIVTSGMYKYVRHPMYTGSLFTLGGLFFVLCGFKIGFCLTTLLFHWLLDRIDREEQVMIYAHGEKYIEYMKRTKVFIPFII